MTQFGKKMKRKRFLVTTEATKILLSAPSDAESILDLEHPEAGLLPPSEKGKYLRTKHQPTDVA